MGTCCGGERKPTLADTPIIHDVRWPAHITCKEQVDALKTVPCRPTDVFVATYPKCGTHWVHKCCRLILDHDHFMFPFEFNQWQLGHSWGGKGMGKGEDGKVTYTSGPPWQMLEHDDIPEPRIIATHAPFEFMPEGVRESKIVYVTRDVKDTCVSYYEFSLKNPFMPEETMESCVDAFVAGGSFDKKANTAGGAHIGGYMYHVKGYVDAAKAGYKVHFVNYDKLQTDQDAEVMKLAKFLGKTLSPEQLADVKSLASFQSMKQAAAEEEVAKGKGKGAIGRLVVGEPMQWSNILYNKGVQGEGKGRMTAEQCTRIDDAHADALKEVGHLFVLEGR